MRPLMLHLLCAVITLPSLAAAEESVPDDDVQALDAAAGEAFASGDYAAAIEHLERAQEIAPHHNRIYNLATCFDAMGDYQRAMDLYYAYRFTGTPPSPLPDTYVRSEERHRTIRLQLQSAERSTIVPASDRLMLITIADDGTVGQASSFPRWALYTTAVLAPLTLILSTMTIVAGVLAFGDAPDGHHALQDDVFWGAFAATCAVTVGFATVLIIAGLAHQAPQPRPS